MKNNIIKLGIAAFGAFTLGYCVLIHIAARYLLVNHVKITGN